MKIDLQSKFPFDFLSIMIFIVHVFIGILTYSLAANGIDTMTDDDNHAAGLMMVGILGFYIALTYLVSISGIIMGVIGFRNIPERKFISIIGILMNMGMFGVCILFTLNN